MITPAQSLPTDAIALTPAGGLPVSSRRLAIMTGICFLITHITAVGAPALYGLATSHLASSAGTDTQILFGALLEVILALAIVGTSVTLYPVMRRWGEGVALGYVGLRTLEAGIIAIGVVPLLTLVTLRHSIAGTVEATTAAAISDTLVMFYKWTLLVGPGLVCGANTVLAAYLMYVSRLVPRFIPLCGLVGGPLIFALTILRILNHYDELPMVLGLLVLPIFLWEISLALWLIIRGFNKAALASAP